MRLLATLLAMVGCYAPQAPAGIPCADVGSPARCPSGQVCVMTGGVERCESSPGTEDDAGLIVDACGDCAERDTDHDGQPDAVDNCPSIANADQANEDGDPYGDACDLCPPFVDAGQDADNDGVGDACDPNPSTGGDAIRYFVGFAGGLPAGWTATGSFTAAGGDGVAVAGANAGATLTIAAPNAARRDVWAGATLDSIAGTALGAIGVADPYEVATDDTIACQLVGLAAGGNQDLRLFNTNSNTLVASTAHAFTAGLATVVHVHRDDSAYVCSATNAAASVNGSATFAPVAPQIGVRIRSATAHVHWVMVTTSP